MTNCINFCRGIKGFIVKYNTKKFKWHNIYISYAVMENLDISPLAQGIPNDCSLIYALKPNI